MTDRIITSRPVNRQAAMVTGRGVHWEPAKIKISPGQVRSDAPLPTRPWPKRALGQDNLTGRIVGRFTVVGLAADKVGGVGGACWVVRCTCGAYEHRRTKALRSPKNPARMMCTHCDYMAEMVAVRVP